MQTPVRRIVQFEHRLLDFRAAMFVGLLFLGSTTASQAQEAIDDVMRELQAWRDQIRSLRVVEEWSCDEHVRGRSPEMSQLSDEELRGYFHRDIWTWTADGSSRFENLIFEKNELIQRELSTCDGHLVSNAEFGRGPIVVNNMLTLGIARKNSHQFSALQGVRMFSLGSLLGIVNGVIDGKRQLSYPPTPDNPLIALENGINLAWLDRRYQYLPVRSQAFWPSLQRTIGSQTTEFQKVDGVLWFPLRGWYDYGYEDGSRARWEIREIQLNAEFPVAEFEPPTPDPGTRVIDERRRQREQLQKGIVVIPPGENPRGDVMDRWVPFLKKYSVALGVLLGGLLFLVFTLSSRPRGSDESKSKR